MFSPADLAVLYVDATDVLDIPELFVLLFYAFDIYFYRILQSIINFATLSEVNQNLFCFHPLDKET